MGRSRRRRRNVEKFGARESRPSQLDGLTQLPQIPDDKIPDPSQVDGFPQLPQIPDDIIRSNIIPRLPGKSLMRFKCVSKFWNSLISDQCGLQHAKAILFSFEYSEQSYDMEWREGIPRFYFMDCEDLIQKLSWEPIEFEYPNEICIAGSCDGLLLIVLKTSFYLWNPVTKYFSHVLELDNLKLDDDSFPRNGNYVVTNSGICYDSCTDDYKVVIGLTDRSIYTPDCKYDPVLVAGLRNKGWRKLKFRYRCDETTSGVLFNGFLHWRANTDHDFCNYVLPNKIIAFDPKTDRVSEVPLPQYYTSEERSVILGLGVLEGCLCMAFRANQVIEVIAMKEYGVEGSWTPLFEISTDHSPFSMDFTSHYWNLIPLLIMQNGNVLMALNGVDVSIFSYNPQTMEYSNDNYPKVTYKTFCHGYPHLFWESLISPTGLEWNKEQHKGHSIGYRRGHLDSDSEEGKSNDSIYPVKHFVDDSPELELEEFEDFMNYHFPHSFFYI